MFLLLPHSVWGILSTGIHDNARVYLCSSSNSMKGLLIGLWYSMLSIKYIFIYNLDVFLLDTISWYIYNLAKGVGIFVSIILFSLACKRYRYREKNEVVNYQNIIEEQYERELLMNESSNEVYNSVDST